MDMGAVRSLTLLPLLCFPLLVHLAVVQGVYSPLVIFSVVWFALIIALSRFSWFGRLAWILAGLIILTFVLYVPGLGAQLMLVPSLLIYSGLAALFGMTLRPGSRPLVTRIARALGDPLDADLLRYTRQVTIVWFGFFVLLSTASIVLWVAAPRELWSMFTNFLAYGLVVFLLLAEFLVRRRRFPFAREKGFMNFLRALLRIEPRELLR